MRNNFDDLVRERCKELLLAGHLAQVIAAQQFMGHTSSRCEKADSSKPHLREVF